MSLEEALNRNTEMLERLCSIMGSVPFRSPDPVTQLMGGQFAHEAQKPQGQWTAEESAATAARQAAQSPNAETKSSSTTDTSPPSSQASVTYDDVKNVTIAVSKIDKAKAVASLARFGVTTAKALNESQWSDYVVYMKRVAAGEVDPEASHE